MDQRQWLGEIPGGRLGCDHVSHGIGGHHDHVDAGHL